MDPTPASGAKKSASDLAFHVIGRNPNTWAIVLIAMVVVLVILVIALYATNLKLDACRKGAKDGMLGTNPLGNLNTGSNNPLWQMQMGDAGWGGSMHSTYQEGQPRVWGASAEGGHDMDVVPQSVRTCGGADCSVSARPPCAVSPAAVGEVDALTAVQALEPASSSAKGMSDDALMSIMNGGSA
jgi:hypothetical protein